MTDQSSSFRLLPSAISLPLKTFIFIIFLTCTSLVSLLFLEFVLSGRPHYCSGHRASLFPGSLFPFPHQCCEHLFRSLHAQGKFAPHDCVYMYKPHRSNQSFLFLFRGHYMSFLVTKGELCSLNSAIIVLYYEVKLLMGIFPVMTASLCCLRTLI